MNHVACVICEGPCGPREENQMYPFCSRRCQLVDLGRWLDGGYRIPGDFPLDPSDDPESGDDVMM